MKEMPHAIDKKRIVHYAQGKFSLRNSKMTTGVIRYSYHESVAVVDSTQAGKTAQDVLGFGGDVPVVASLEEAQQYNPEAMLVGLTPAGGRLNADVKQACLKSIDMGLHCYAGLHDFLENDMDIATAADMKGVDIWDIRKPPPGLPIGGGLTRWAKSYIATMVGSDAAIGKMTVALEIERAARKQGIDYGFVATGQCGIAIAGWGSPVDAIAGDFMAGAVEKDCLEIDGHCEAILVEGQGSLYHPGFSSVTLGVLHGSCPDGLILCHQLSRTSIANLKEIPIPPLLEVAEMYLANARPFRPHVKVIGVSFNTSGFPEDEARAAIDRAEADFGVPATDPVRFGAGKLVEAVQNHRRQIGK